MKLNITGDQREIANSAWISTMSERVAKSRTNQDVERVVKFLVEHNHSSPLESVTLSFESEGGAYSDESSLLRDYDSAFAKLDFLEDKGFLTLDLLNFIKITKLYSLEEKPLWSLFQKTNPILFDYVSNLSKLQKDFAEDVSKIIGKNNIKVELVNYHHVHDDLPSHNRATWRIRCPLSIAVQQLRHRKGSFNMLSGKYKTIMQGFFDTPDDCSLIAGKFNESMDRYFGAGEASISRYRQFMKKAKIARNNDKISNDEYKRVREVARFILPEGRMTELYVTFYLEDFYQNYLLLRDSKHAQVEHTFVAQSMRRALEEKLREMN